VAERCTSLGSAWNLAQRQTLNMISDLEAVRYKRDPIIFLYSVILTGLDTLSKPSDVAGGVLIGLASSNLNLLSSSLTYFDWCIYVLSSVCWIWSPRKKFEFSHHAHFKFFLRYAWKILAKNFISSTKYNIININLHHSKFIWIIFTE